MDGVKLRFEYPEHYEEIRALSHKQKGMLFDAILDYAVSGKEPQFSSRDYKLWMVWYLCVKDRIEVL